MPTNKPISLMTLLDQIRSLYSGLPDDEIRQRMACREVDLALAMERLAMASVEIVSRPKMYSYTLGDTRGKTKSRKRALMAESLLVPWVRVEHVGDDVIVFRLVSKVLINGEEVEIPLSKRRWRLHRGVVMLRRRGTVMGFIADDYLPKGKIKIQGADVALVTRYYFYEHLGEALSLP